MCTYTYEDKEAKITSFSVVGADLTIFGAFLPTQDATIRFANQDCDDANLGTDQIRCKLAKPLVAGNWLPEVLTADGLVDFEKSQPVAPI